MSATTSSTMGRRRRLREQARNPTARELIGRQFTPAQIGLETLRDDVGWRQPAQPA